MNANYLSGKKATSLKLRDIIRRQQKKNVFKRSKVKGKKVRNHTNITFVGWGGWQIRPQLASIALILKDYYGNDNENGNLFTTKVSLCLAM